MKKYEGKLENVSGGYNVAWLILVQAVGWNVLFPIYLINSSAFFFAFGVYFAVLIAVASKQAMPDFEAMSPDELLQSIEEQRREREAYKLIPSRIKTKFSQKQPKKNTPNPCYKTNYHSNIVI